MGVACAGGPAACGRSSPAAPSAKPSRPAARVKVAPVQGGTVRRNWRFAGEVRASARSELAAGVEGAVWRVTVREGDGIRRGRLLVQVDDRLPRARVEVAEAEVQRAQQNLEQAKVELRRLNQLREGIVPAIELDRARTTRSVAKADLRRARANLTEAKAQLALTAVRAPFDGAVVRRLVDRGDWVKVGDPVMEVVRTEDPEVQVDASSDVLSQLAPKDAAVGRQPGRRPVPLQVLGVVPALDPIRRTARIRLGVAEGDHDLVPGAPIDVQFDLAVRRAGVVVPRDALLVSPSETRVARVVDGTAELFPVEVLVRSSSVALVRSDTLQVGDLVVVQGNERLRPGQSVQRVGEGTGGGRR